MKSIFLGLLVGLSFVLTPFTASAQDVLPDDNGLATYHTAPRYRESESHPLRIIGYVLHPIGWVAREVIFRPLSYFASSTETTRSVMGFREPFDYRKPECFSADDSVPDCRAVNPFNYETGPVAADSGEHVASLGGAERQVYFPDVNFDFDKKGLNNLGEGRVRQVANLLSKEGGLTVVLEGHSDFKGSDEYNQKLGMDRAETVRAELANLGIDTARLSTVSFGETKPLLAEETDWARAVNRRVSVTPTTTAKGMWGNN